MRTLGLILLFAVIGSLVGIAVGVVMSAAIGWVLGLGLNVSMDGVVFGGVIGALTGAIIASGSSEGRAWSYLSGTSFSGGAPGPESSTHVSQSPRTPEKPLRQGPKPVVLFLCTGNPARSQMAEALLKKYAGDRFDVYSAGLTPKGIHPLTFRVMAEVGLDISAQTSKGLRQFLGKLAVRFAITVCEPVEEGCPHIWPGALTQLAWPLEDPAAWHGVEEEQVARFRIVRDRIDGKIRQWLAETEVSRL